jgi:hypothetical protein
MRSAYERQTRPLDYELTCVEPEARCVNFCAPLLAAGLHLE